MEKKKSNIKLLRLNFSAVEVPTFKEEKNKDYVVFGHQHGYVNNYPQYCIDLYLKSAKQKALIDGKIDFIAGRGFDIEKDANISNESRAQINAFINKANPDESLKQVNRKFIKDEVIHGGFYMEIIWSEEGSISEVNHLPFKDIRRNADKTLYFYTQDWTKSKPSNNEDWQEIPAFDIEERKGKAVIFFGDDCEIYPLPSYIGAMNHIEADIELSTFDLSNIKNQFQPSAMIEFFNGQPSEEEMDEIERQFQDKFQGSENAGELMLSYNDDPDRAAKVTVFSPSNLDKQYQVLEARIDSSLLVAHKVIDPILFGWPRTGGGLGNNAEQLRTANESYQVRYAGPQQELYEDLYNNIISVNGLPKVLHAIPLAQIQPQLSSATIEANLTQDEIRERMGLAPIEGIELNIVAEALGSLPPLVATKVLDNMTTQEIREIVGLANVPVVRTTQTISKNFSTEDAQEIILEHFEGCGVDANLYEVISSREIYPENIEEFSSVHNEFRQEFKVLESLTLEDLKVLNIINESPTLTISDIAEASGYSITEVEAILEKLQSSGALETGAEGDQPDRRVTEDGKESIKEGGEDKLQVKYKYTLRSDVPPAKTGSRAFCKRLMATNKLFTKEDIFRLNFGRELDVFRYRGGYYNNPSIGRTTPWCRHIWTQQLVKVK